MAQYKIYLVQYSRFQFKKGDDRRHMGIVVETDSTQEFGTTFHITGSEVAWTYERQRDVHFKHGSYCGSCVLGTMPASPAALDALHKLLGTIALRHNEPTFNSQRWVWEAALLMRERGYQVNPPTTFPSFIAAMHAAFDKWDVPTLSS